MIFNKLNIVVLGFKVLCLLSVVELFLSYRFPFNPLKSIRRQYLSSTQLGTMSSHMAYPTVASMDEDNSVALINVCVSGENTLKAFNDACAEFNTQAKVLNPYNATMNATMSPDTLYRIFGENKIKLFSLQFLSSVIAVECNKTGLPLVGGGSLVNFQVDDFLPGQPLELTVRCSLMPQVVYEGGDGYKRLSLEVPSLEEYKQTKISEYQRDIRERYRVFATDEEYKAQEEDAVLVDMKGHLLREDGSKGELERSLCNPQINVVLSPRRTHPQLVKALLGCTIGQQLTTEVSFEGASEGPAALLQGNRASVELRVLGISTLPSWEESLARAIHPQLNLTELDRQIEEEVSGGAEDGLHLLRNEILAVELLRIANTTKIPEVLLRDSLSGMFQDHLAALRSMGITDNNATSSQRVEDFRLANLKRAERAVKLALVLRDIAKREGITATEREVNKTLLDIASKASYENKTINTADPILRLEIEDSLVKVAVLDYVANIVAKK